MSDKFNEVEVGKLNKVFDNKLGSSLPAEITKAGLGVGIFDFADDMADVARKGGNANQAPGVFPEDGRNGFIKFQDDNTLYNVYDAGNFMTGKAFNLIGEKESTVSGGAHIHNVILGREGGGLADSKADQRALHNGYNYKGVVLKK